MTKYIRGGWRLIYQCTNCGGLGQVYNYICPTCGDAESLLQVVGRTVHRQGFFSIHFECLEKKCDQPEMPSLLYRLGERREKVD